MTAPRQTGFTLLELMVSMIISAIVLLLGASMLGRTGDGYGRLSGGVSAEREARALLVQLTGDLCGARWNDESVIEKDPSDWAKDRLGILSLQAPDAQSTGGRIGDLCVVNYYLKDLPVRGGVIRCLMRGTHESQETFTALRAGTLATQFAPQDKDEPVAFGVVAFQARPKVRNASGVLQDWSRTAGSSPQVLDITLIIARREALGRLHSSEDWDGATAAAKRVLGDPSLTANNARLAVYTATLDFGNDATR